MVQRSEVMKAAEAKARRIVENARAEASRQRNEADDFCDKRLAQLETVLERTMTVISSGRAKLRGPAGEGLPPTGRHGAAVTANGRRRCAPADDPAARLRAVRRPGRRWSFDPEDVPLARRTTARSLGRAPGRPLPSFPPVSCSGAPVPATRDARRAAAGPRPVDHPPDRRRRGGRRRGARGPGRHRHGHRHRVGPVGGRVPPLPRAHRWRGDGRAQRGVRARPGRGRDLPARPRRGRPGARAAGGAGPGPAAGPAVPRRLPRPRPRGPPGHDGPRRRGVVRRRAGPRRPRWAALDALHFDNN